MEPPNFNLTLREVNVNELELKLNKDFRPQISLHANINRY